MLRFKPSYKAPSGCNEYSKLAFLLAYKSYSIPLDNLKSEARTFLKTKQDSCDQSFCAYTLKLDINKLNKIFTEIMTSETSSMGWVWDDIVDWSIYSFISKHVPWTDFSYNIWTELVGDLGIE
jgi:hypothetical protein